MTARIPFALVGVLLLVGSATFAGSLAGPTVREPTVDRAMDRTEAATQSAVRDAVSAAAVAAARHPVTSPASTPVGNQLDSGDTFRDALRIRIYVAVRDRLDRITRRDWDVTVNASLPATPTADALGEQLDRVSIARAGDRGTDLRVTVRNVTLTARRHGEVVGRRTLSPTVTVPVPTLAVHDRVETFERRLNAGPLAAGLGGRLTAQLYALTWARGYAQYGGAPIQNVLGNRHIALLTNRNVLAMQRAYFGASDPRGNALLKWATLNTALTDVLSGAGTPVANHLMRTHTVLGLKTLPSKVLNFGGGDGPQPSPRDDVTVSVGKTADTAFDAVYERLNTTIEKTYAARFRLRTRVVERFDRVVEQPMEPAPGWELLEKTTETTTSVRKRDAKTPSLLGMWHPIGYYPRTVSVRRTIHRRWNTSNGVYTTTEVREEGGAVDVVFAGLHDSGPAPPHPILPVHQRGGALDGPNLADALDEAEVHFFKGRRVERMAKRAIRTGGETQTKRFTGKRPDGIYEYVYEGVAQLRDRVRDLSVTTTRGRLATMQVNPAARLVAKLNARWDSLVDAPTIYDGVAERARVNARVYYLREVRRKLRERADAHAASTEGLSDELDERDARSLDEMQRAYDQRGSGATPASLGLRVRVQTAPSYLTLGKLDSKSVATLPPGESTTPLAVRNVNLFTVPYGGFASKILDTLLAPKRVRLSTAVQALAAAKRADESVDTKTLQAKIERANEALLERAESVVVRHTQWSASDAGPVVREALSRWQTPLDRARAWLDGSAARAIQEEVTDRASLSSVSRDLLRVDLRTTVRLGLETSAVQPPKTAVSESVAVVRRLATSELARVAQERLRKQGEKILKRSTRLQASKLRRLPAGLPLAPPVAPWVTTVNFWQVQVRGEYTRFTVSVPYGTPDSPGGRFIYVRDSGAVRLDYDGDGTVERLGRTGRIDFRTHTSVAIAVPPGPPGVGDVDGVMDEQSPGWPSPG